jgi:hypothetical protein
LPIDDWLRLSLPFCWLRQRLGRQFQRPNSEDHNQSAIGNWQLAIGTTFSAGLFHAMQLRQQANAILVGEPFGDELDFWAEGGNAVAPNSKLSLHYADRLHSYSPAERPESKQYLVIDTDLSITKATPDIIVRIRNS